MFDYEIDVCQAVLQNETLDEKQKEIAANLIEKGFLITSDNGEINCNIPVFTKEQHDLFTKSATDIFGDFLPFYAEKIGVFVDGHIKLFPKHLKDDARLNGAYLFAAMFNAIARDWLQRGKIVIPDGAVCDALMYI